MAGEAGAPAVLIRARAAAARRALAVALGPGVAARPLAPAALADPAPLVDAAAAVAALDADDDEASLAALAGLGALPAGRALVLCLDAAPPALAEAALEKLAPAQVVSRGDGDAVLRYALARALPSAAPGRGARSNQRPTAALLGVSGAIRDVIEQVRQIAPTPIPVLILGETGTGKEIVARAIHEQGPRARGPFVAVNCAALPDTLLESELFGHRRGAFTGATREKRGLFEHAAGGTLFLDEIGDTTPALQRKLLRVLETREVRPVGETRTVPVDVRVVSATHRDLEAAIADGSFRQDLFYRLNAVAIYVPPLRRRRVDVPFLAQHFAEELGASDARRITLDEDFLDSLACREFPGNVRELRNTVERAIALAAPDGRVTRSHLPAVTGGGLADLDLARPLKEIVGRVESEAIRAALSRFRGNRRRAAESLGLTAPGLRYKMRRLGLGPDGSPEPPSREEGP